MLATLRRLTELDAQTRARKRMGSRFADLLDDLGELGGRTVGLVGFGAVGKCLAPMLQGDGRARPLYQPARIAAAACDVRVVPRSPALGGRRVAACAVDVSDRGHDERARVWR